LTVCLDCMNRRPTIKLTQPNITCTFIQTIVYHRNRLSKIKPTQPNITCTFIQTKVYHIFYIPILYPYQVSYCCLPILIIIIAIKYDSTTAEINLYLCGMCDRWFLCLLINYSKHYWSAQPQHNDKHPYIHITNLYLALILIISISHNK
jgi:hypothetical protein